MHKTGMVPYSKKKMLAKNETLNSTSVCLVTVKLAQLFIIIFLITQTTDVGGSGGLVGSWNSSHQHALPERQTHSRI